MGWSNDFWGGYTPSKPIKVDGGIKTKSKRGSIGDTWWSKRWVKVLESFGWSNRLERGRRYARSGQVLDFKIKSGRVTARVQGSAKKPYSVSIDIEPFSDEAWNRAADVMSQKAIFAAKLLSGEMPQNIEEAFDEAGMSLFPRSDEDIHTDCSCPDFANPCKHIAALYYVLAEEFDRDPFMLFKLRGKTKDEIISSLREKRTECDEMIHGSEMLSTDDEICQKEEKKEETLSVSDFWSGEKLEAFSVNIAPPDVPMTVIKRLGPPPFWDRNEDFIGKMGIYYEEISRTAIEIAYGEQIKPKKKLILRRKKIR